MGKSEITREFIEFFVIHTKGCDTPIIESDLGKIGDPSAIFGGSCRYSYSTQTTKITVDHALYAPDSRGSLTLDIRFRVHFLQDPKIPSLLSPKLLFRRS